MGSRFSLGRMFGGEKWAAGIDRWSLKLFRQVRTKPPACLDAFQTEAAHDETHAGHLQWVLGCRCGGRTGCILGYPLSEANPEYEGPEMYVSPLAYRCSACNETTEMFDSAEHGYDAECGKLEGVVRNYSVRGSGERTAAPCPGCGATDYTVVAGSIFSHFDLIEDEPQLRPRVQDFFDSFGCQGRCEACGNTWYIAGFELA